MQRHLHELILANRCRSTHHYIVMDALTYLDGPGADDWRALFLHHHDALLEGAKAPDTKFKDFQNHVLHVGGDSEWGGARTLALEWYGKSVEALRAEDWREAAYALGVLSHYFADPHQPFHTDQSEAEGAMHRAVEWSIFKSRPALRQRMMAAGLPDVKARREADFVSHMVRAGAELSHPHYTTFIDHYNLEAGRKDPLAGMDETLLDVTADLLRHAVAGLSVIFQRAIEAAGVRPAQVSLDLDIFFAKAKKPVHKLIAKIDDSKTRGEVAAAWKEFRKTGKVIDSLSDDDAEIRCKHAKQVRGILLKELNAEPAGPIGRKHGLPLGADVPAGSAEPAEIDLPDTTPAPAQPRPSFHARPEPVVSPVADETARDQAPAEPKTIAAEPDIETPVAAKVEAEIEPPKPSPLSAPSNDTVSRSGLRDDANVVLAPSIGKKTARRLNGVGIETVGDLLAADPEVKAAELGVSYIDAQAIRDWQDQTRLKRALPHLRVHDVQVLVGSGVRTLEELATISAADLFETAVAFVKETSAERTIGRLNKPTRSDISQWIAQARHKTAA